ncbi:hypothetical protein ARMA_2444 [Ardenticatena maritima]|uniref:Uncharacterized protein n=1 Tax=Ardenticatena maritima TaxID=872965 RepID=A0A0M8KA63_9CHLR|nr:hypothetical protein [Ardenticatena maritima]KPL88401.1 hypothetical protein SE16_06205 [Ardenticatena maritima]GAP64021.1 hypothetical protein ARMA_2444 [Ardenticatena maritima]
MQRQTMLDLAVSLLIGLGVLLFLHADHLVNTYTAWDDPTWWWHLLTDGGYVLVYGGMAYVALRGWARWRRQEPREKERERWETRNKEKP